MIKETNIENGKKLQGFRIQNSLTVKEVAKICGMSERMVKYWEVGQYAIPRKVIDKLNEEYNLRLVWESKSGAKVCKTQIAPIEVKIKKQNKEIKKEVKHPQTIKDYKQEMLKVKLLNLQKSFINLTAQVNTIMQLVE